MPPITTGTLALMCLCLSCLDMSRGAVRLMKLQMPKDDKLQVKEISSDEDYDEDAPTWTLGVMKARDFSCAHQLSTSLLVPVSIWSNTFQESQEISAYYCVQTRDVWVKPTLTEPSIRHTSIPISNSITPAKCAHMVKHTSSPDGQILDALNRTTHGSNNKIILDDVIVATNSTWTRELFNYYIHRVTLQVDPFTARVSASDLPETPSYCFFGSNSCNMRFGMLIWNINNPSKHICSLKHHKSSQCYINMDQLYCPSLALTFMGDRLASVDRCGKRIGLFRAAIQDQESDTNSSTLTIDTRARYKLDLDFSSLYRSISLGQPAYVNILHISSCSVSPTTLEITKLQRAENFPFDSNEA